MTDKPDNDAPDPNEVLTPEERDSLPTAVLKQRMEFSWLWLLPLIAVIAAGGLIYRTWTLRGVIVTVELPEGYGLKPGDPVRYRGITVGEVREVGLAEGVGNIEVTVSLRSQGGELARGGSRFWVVRPRIGLAGISGIETLFGPQYLAVLPGDGPRQRSFVGLADPPVVETIEHGDLEIILRAPARRGLRAGSPVTYREVRIGEVMSVGLTSDASAVEARVHIEKPYAVLVRDYSKFWIAGGVKAQVGLTGVALNMDSLETLIIGGIAVATPPPDKSGDQVHTGHRFVLASEPDAAWLRWEPNVAIGSEMLPAGVNPPSPMRARISWDKDALFGGSKSRQGWVIMTSRGLLGPTDLLQPDDNAEEGTAIIELAGREIPLTQAPAWSRNGVALLDDITEGRVRDWPAARIRGDAAVEDCLAIGDPTAPPLPLAASRLEPIEGGWLLDEGVPVDETWHGACVVARSDGALRGVMLVDDDGDDVRIMLVDLSAE